MISTQQSPWEDPKNVCGMDASVPYSTWEKWFYHFPIDAEGQPTSDAAYRLIRYLFEHRDHAFAAGQLANELVLHPELVRCTCRQLELIDLVLQEPPASGRFRYCLHSRNTDLQAKVEAALIEFPARVADLSLPNPPAG